MTGSIVSVSASLPSTAPTVSGKPVASVSSPTVICGSRRRSLENPDRGTHRRCRSRSTAWTRHRAPTTPVPDRRGPRTRLVSSAIGADRRAPIGVSRSGNRPKQPRSQPRPADEPDVPVGSMTRGQHRLRGTSSPPVAVRARALGKPGAGNPQDRPRTRRCRRARLNPSRRWIQIKSALPSVGRWWAAALSASTSASSRAERNDQSGANRA